MKKNFSFTLLILFLMFFSFVIFPVKVSANSRFDGTADDWFNHISQFDYGIAYSEIYQVRGDFGTYTEFGLLIVEEPLHEVEGCIFEYRRHPSSEYWIYLEPSLRSVLENEILRGNGHYYADIEGGLESVYGEDFDGYLYWNFEQGYWQIEYYGTSELDYYKQRVDDLEDEIQQLEGEISLLENEIQRLEEALDFEYERGYNEGYQIGYNEGLLVENNDITKWFVPLVVIIIVVGIFESIRIFKRREE